MSISFLEMRRRFQPTPEPLSTYYNSYTPSPSPSSFLQLLPPFRNNYCTRSTILFFCVLIITDFPLPHPSVLPRFDSFLPSPLPSPPLPSLTGCDNICSPHPIIPGSIWVSPFHFALEPSLPIPDVRCRYPCMSPQPNGLYLLLCSISRLFVFVPAVVGVIAD